MAKRRTTEEFITEAIAVHGNTYDYSLVKYINKDTRVEIICPIHGVFEQIPHNHLRGAICKKCSIPIGTKKSAKTQTKSQETFLSQVKEKHGDKYNYDKVTYTRAADSITITCKLHGDFEQRAFAHLSGQGCPKCAKIQRDKDLVLPNEVFIEKAINVHGDRYEYTLTNYTGMRNPITATCKIHGEFTLRAQDHLSGSGCQYCGNINSTANYLNEPTLLYFLFFPKHNVYKLGITIVRHGVKNRYKTEDVDYEVLYVKEFPTGKSAYCEEQKLLSKNRDIKYEGPPILKGGNSEILTKSIMEQLE